MAISESLLPEFDHEMAVTRTLLERVPDAQAAWKPHQKSFSMGDLAVHLVNLPSWGTETLTTTELDLNPPDGPSYPKRSFESAAALLDTFDENVRAAREALSRITDSDMMQPWTLKSGGHTILTMPRVAVFRSMVLNHVIHHRGQLSVYLRLNDIPLPSIYGPSADSAH